MMPLVSMRQFESKSELMEYIRQASGPKSVLGERADAPGEFYCVHIDSTDVRTFIGILSHGIGATPSWIVKGSTVMIGFNEQIAMFSLSAPSGYREVELSDLFRAFLDVDGPHTCVRCEASIVALDAAGSIVWVRRTDLITETSVIDSFLALTFIDDPPIKIDLMTGDVLANSPAKPT
jgi:hypothetical protein